MELLKESKAGKLAHGTSWSYSNSGYVVLGLIVAKSSGKSYGEFLRERIFAPLKMNHTIVYQKGKNEVTNRAYGHSKENDAFKETDQSPTSATLGDGGIYSSLEDLAKWNDALRNHILLSEKEMQPALTPVKLNDGSQPYWPQRRQPSSRQIRFLRFWLVPRSIRWPSADVAHQIDDGLSHGNRTPRKSHHHRSVQPH